MSWKDKGSGHYRVGGIEPWEYIAANKLDFWEGNIVKYITRWRNKGTPIQDIDKLIHYAEYLKETYVSKETYASTSSEPIKQPVTKKSNGRFGWLRRLFKRKRNFTPKDRVSGRYWPFDGSSTRL